VSSLFSVRRSCYLAASFRGQGSGGADREPRTLSGGMIEGVRQSVPGVAALSTESEVLAECYLLGFYRGKAQRRVELNDLADPLQHGVSRLGILFFDQ
jgi:hypothetical protein